MELFHLINRGVEKRAVVLDDHDRLRFIHDLFAFNDSHPSKHSKQPERNQETQRRKLLVHIHAYCLMNNHYHLLVSEKQKGGISKFMKKINMGYAKYFNQRYNRSGYLWQGKYKKVRVKDFAHNLYVPYYVHLNALDYTMPEWRQGSVQNLEAALQHLEAYRWSSHRDYLGERNFPSVIYFQELASFFGTPSVYKKNIKEIIGNPFYVQETEELELP